jgi:uncharacterized repeat protein (TIGR03943 family)
MKLLAQVSLVVIGVTLLRFWREGKLTSYIHPSTVWLVVLAAIILIGLVLVRAGRLHSHATPTQIIAICAIAVLLAGIRNVPLSISLAAGRTLGGAAALSGRTSVNIQESTDQYTEADWLSAWNESPDHTRYLGQPADVQGFVLTQSGQPYVMRMLITCCIVDAQPLALAFQKKKPTPKDGSWVDVRGTMGQSGGLPLIQTSSIRSVPEPSDTYLY